MVNPSESRRGLAMGVMREVGDGGRWMGPVDEGRVGWVGWVRVEWVQVEAMEGPNGRAQVLEQTGDGETRRWRTQVMKARWWGFPIPDVSDVGLEIASGMTNHLKTTSVKEVFHPTYANHYCSYHSWVAEITAKTIVCAHDQYQNRPVASRAP
ncbi:MAG: hypothetical protein LBV00_02310 [Propionibacteriaceae bacterium]|nr:hypothetical protein [Propionibacteriaceae bacterium]